jgi:peptidoglycan/LPS O-acetylase OafA/YrhL
VQEALKWPRPTDRPARSNALDAIRAIACLMVILCHVSFYRGNGDLVGLQNGVMLFFGLSGYLLYRPFVIGDVDLRRYAIHRVTRIAPAYLIALVGVSALSGDPTFHLQPLTYLSFQQNYDPDLWQGFFGVSWTLVIEVMFYLTLPVLAVVVARSPRRLAIIAISSFIAAVSLWYLVPSGDPRQPSSIYPAVIWVFTPGMFVALMEGRMRCAARPATLAFGIALMLAGTRVYWASIDVPSALGTFLIIAWAVERRPALGPLARPAAIGAALTYSVYLWHVDFLKAIEGPPAALVLTLAVASAVYVTVERPAIRLGRRLARGIPAPSTSVSVAAT